MFSPVEKKPAMS